MLDDDEMREAERVQQVINFKNLVSQSASQPTPSRLASSSPRTSG